jgi:SpoVK/Ycf46/Vps4 family AAA+-type ATPase
MTKSAFDSAVSLAITEYSNRNGNAEGLNLDTIMHQIRAYKTSSLRKTNVLELLDPIDIDQVGGLDHLKEWLEHRRNSFSEEAIEFGITPSRGGLVVGPPGGGKSLIAKAACAVLNIPGVRFDVGRVFNSYIGQSEQAMRTVLKTIDDMSPCVMFVDEIDKGFQGMGGGSNDSGTTSRVFGTFLTWMQERDQKERPVFLVMTANRVANLPAELMRRGRIDEIWGVSYPNSVERAAIVNIHVGKRGHKLTKDQVSRVVDITEDLVGAEIESMIEDALNLDFNAKNSKLTLESLEQARSTLKPQAKSFAAQMVEMNEWIAINARPASPTLTPEQVKSGPGNKIKLRPQVGQQTCGLRQQEPRRVSYQYVNQKFLSPCTHDASR